MSDPIQEKLEQIKQYIEEGYIVFGGIDSAALPLETDEVQFFLKVAEDILKLDDAIPFKDISVSNHFMERLKTGLIINFNSRKGFQYDNKDYQTINLGLQRFDDYYIDFESKKLVPLTTYRSTVHETFHFIFDDLFKYKTKQTDTQAEESLTVKFTDKVMKKHGEPARQTYLATGTIYTGKKARAELEKNIEHFGMKAEGYGDFLIEEKNVKDVYASFIHATYDEIEDELSKYKNDKKLLKHQTPEQIKQNLKAYQEEFEKLWTLEREVLGDEEALISLIAMARSVDLETFKPNDERKLTPEEIKRVLEIAESADNVDIKTDGENKSVVFDNKHTIDL